MHAIKIVGIAIENNVSINACLRPIKSPIRPKNSPPRGLTKKPTAKAPKAAIREMEGLFEGKNCLPIVDAKYPYSAKSYHSITLPTRPASITRMFVFNC